MIRVFGCQGSIQLVAALVAGETCRGDRAATDRNYLVIHDLLPFEGDSHERFARALGDMARMVGTWERVVYLSPSVVQELGTIARKRGRGALLAALGMQIGTAVADEIYLTSNRIPTNELLLNAYRPARKICYGDGIGVNYSPEYFRVPPVPRPPVPPPPGTVASALRATLRGGRKLVRAVRDRLFDARPWLEGVPFDLYCLLLPNLFDEEVGPVIRSDPKEYVALFDRLGATLDRPDGDPCAGLVRALDSAAGAVVLLTANFTEVGRMAEDDEVAGYRELIDELQPDPDWALVLKPHPRDRVEKIRRLREELGGHFRHVVVLDAPLLFYLTFEVIFARHLLPRMHREPPLPVRVVTVSSACLSLELLYEVPCTLGFGAERVRRLFYPHFVEKRLQHEADLRRVVQQLRRTPTS